MCRWGRTVQEETHRHLVDFGAKARLQALTPQPQSPVLSEPVRMGQEGAGSRQPDWGKATEQEAQSPGAADALELHRNKGEGEACIAGSVGCWLS